MYAAGFLFGPIFLIVVYASKLFEIISCHQPDVHCYTDDTQLYLSFKADSHVTSHAKTCINDFPCMTGIPCGSRVTLARF